MAEIGYEKHLKELLAKGLSTEEEIREARRLLQEAAREGRALSVAEALLRAGAQAAKAHHDAAAAPQRVTGDTDTEVIQGSDLLVIERLGRGSQSVVCKCHQITLDRTVAVKILPSSLARNPQMREQFFREARHAARLSHPNIVAIHQISPLRDTFYIVMEFVDGGSVAEMLAERKRFDPAEAVTIVRAAAQGLACAHRAGIIHQDVKPKNILLTTTGIVKLADLGVARRIDDGDASVSAGAAAPGGPSAPAAAPPALPASSAGTTGTSSKIQGTPYYMSPEQVTGDPPVDFRTDIYSLGATFYEMLSGHPPFTAPTPQEVMRKHVIEPPPDPRQDVPDLPAGVSAIVAKCMAKEPEDRYASADGFIAALDALEFDAPVAEVVEPPPDVEKPAPPPSPAADRRRTGRTGTAARSPAASAEPPFVEGAALDAVVPDELAAMIEAAVRPRSAIEPPVHAQESVQAQRPSLTELSAAAQAGRTPAGAPTVDGETADRQAAIAPTSAPSATEKPGPPAVRAAGRAALVSPGGPRIGGRSPEGRKPKTEAYKPQAAASAQRPQTAGSRRNLVLVSVFGLLFVAVVAVAAVVLTLGNQPGAPLPKAKTPTSGLPVASATASRNPRDFDAEPISPEVMKQLRADAQEKLREAQNAEHAPEPRHDAIVETYGYVVKWYPQTPEAVEARAALARLGTALPTVVAPPAKLLPTTVGGPPPKTPLPVAVPPPPPPPPPPVAAGRFVLRVECGSDLDYTDQDGNKWLADQPFGGGKTWGCVEGMQIRRAPHAIPGTRSPDVYLTEKYSMKAYRFNLDKGKYTLRLHFCETFASAVRQRLFDVKVQGQQVLSGFDVFREAGGSYRPLVKEFKGVVVADGTLLIEFSAQASAAEINGIEIIAE